MILKREDELRMSREYHTMISEHDTLEWIRDVTENLQKSVLREFGYDAKLFLPYLQSARARYINDPEMNKITVYQRMDRSRKGMLARGSALPNVKLCTLNEGSEIFLHDYIAKVQNNSGGRPMIITAGSIT